MLASNDLAQIRECHPFFSCEGTGEFLRSYWDDAGKIVAAAVEYRRLAHLERGELCLADIVAQ